MSNVVYGSSHHRIPGTRAIEELNEFRRAEQECSAHVRSTLAMDSAAAVYDAALTGMGVDTSELRRHGAAALRAAYLQHRGGTPRIAMDTASTNRLLERFPNARRLG